jgi:CRP-like cAMP-binding protein
MTPLALTPHGKRDSK